MNLAPPLEILWTMVPVAGKTTLSCWERGETNVTYIVIGFQRRGYCRPVVMGSTSVMTIALCICCGERINTGGATLISYVLGVEVGIRSWIGD